jgi:hypothetical protein
MSIKMALAVALLLVVVTMWRSQKEEEELGKPQVEWKEQGQRRLLVTSTKGAQVPSPKDEWVDEGPMIAVGAVWKVGEGIGPPEEGNEDQVAAATEVAVALRVLFLVVVVVVVV